MLSEAQIKTQKMGGVLGVGQGSERPPRFVLGLAYDGPKVLGWRPPLAFVGKGVVFDSGGLSLKTARGHGDMKTDMAGAAAVIGAMSALQSSG